MATPAVGDTYYIEHVTRDPAATSEALAAAHGWTFSAPDATLGGARVATLPSGARCGVRAPLSADEQTVTRTYVRVADLERAVERAAKHGAVVMLPPTPLPGHGRISIWNLHGTEHGAWEPEA